MKQSVFFRVFSGCLCLQQSLQSSALCCHSARTKNLLSLSRNCVSNSTWNYQWFLVRKPSRIFASVSVDTYGGVGWGPCSLFSKSMFSILVFPFRHNINVKHSFWFRVPSFIFLSFFALFPIVLWPCFLLPCNHGRVSVMFTVVAERLKTFSFGLIDLFFFAWQLWWNESERSDSGERRWKGRSREDSLTRIPFAARSN